MEKNRKFIRSIWNRVKGNGNQQGQLLDVEEAARTPACQVQQIYLFISSTFNDMHAERDYLVKYVLPELKNWCFERNLELIDIDLRWGITDEEAAMNQTVDTCLNIIRRNIPMLLINLTGERAGWIPSFDDVSDAFKKNYPKMTTYIGDRSITELEVLFYEMISIFDGDLFLFREISGPCQWNSDQKRCYTNEGSPDKRELDKKVRVFKKKMLRTSRAFCYLAEWDAELASPELKEMEVGGVPAEHAFMGRFCNFTCEGVPLKDFIIRYLENIISSRIESSLTGHIFTGHSETQMQQRFLIQQGVTYLAFPGMFAEVEKFLNFQTGKRFLFLTGEAGCGKSSYLSHFILTHREQFDIHYRFCGISRESMSEAALLNSLVKELADIIFEKTRKDSEKKRYGSRMVGRPLEFPDVITYIYEEDLQNVNDIQAWFPNLMNQMEVSVSRPVIIILDAIDQLDYASMSWSWLNPMLYLSNGCGVRFIISCKSGTPHEEKLRETAPESQCVWIHNPIMGEMPNRLALIRYLTSHHLKHLSADQETCILNAPQSRNPLFLKSVTEEICTWGIRTQLDQYLQKLIGQDLENVFSEILCRGEQDQPYCQIAPDRAIPAVMGLLAYSRYGLYEPCLVRACRYFLRHNADRDVRKEFSQISDSAIEEIIHYYTYQLKHFLIFSQGKTDILYDSFRMACQKRYAAYKKEYHEALAHAYLTDMDAGLLDHPETEEAYLEWPYHAVAAGETQAVLEHLEDLSWVTCKACLNQLYQLPELYRSLPEEQQDEQLILWLENNEGLLCEEPESTISFYLNCQAEKLWKNEKAGWPWLVYHQRLPEFTQKKYLFQKKMYVSSEIEFEKTRIHKGILYLGYSTDMGTGITAYHAETLRPLLCVLSGNVRCYYSEDIIIQYKKTDCVIYEIHAENCLVKRSRICHFPPEDEIIDFWYEQGKVFLWTTQSKVSVKLSCAPFTLRHDSVTEFEDLSWSTLYELKIWKACSRISSENFRGAGILIMENSERGAGRTILYTYLPFKILLTKEYPAWGWERKGEEMFLLHWSEKRSESTELYTKQGKLLFGSDAYLDLTEIDADGTFYFHVSGELDSAVNFSKKQKKPVRLAGDNAYGDFSLSEESMRHITYRTSDGTIDYEFSPFGFYRCNIYEANEGPTAVAVYDGQVMFLEKYQDYLVTQELTTLHLIPLSENGFYRHLRVPQQFLGAGIGNMPGESTRPWQITDHYLDVVSTSVSGFARHLVYTHADLDRLPVQDRTEENVLWKCEGERWSCRLTKAGILQFHPAGGTAESWNIRMIHPKIHLWENGVLGFWQDKKLVLLDTAGGSDPVCIYDDFQEDILQVTAGENRVWVITDPGQSAGDKIYRIYEIFESGRNSYKLSLRQEWEIDHCLSDGGSCLIFLGKKGRRGYPGNTRILRLRDKNGKSYQEELTRFRDFYLFENGSFVFADFSELSFYDITEDKLIKLKYRKSNISYDCIIGTWGNYCILKSANRRMGCFYDYIEDRIVLSFPMPEDIEYAVRVGRDLYLQRQNQREMLAASTVMS